MAYPRYIREKARELRSEKRLTLDEISERLAISKTTVWYWIQDLPLAPPGKALQTPARRAARLRAARAHSERAALIRHDAYVRGKVEFPELAKDPAFRDFVCMYIGEGYRRNRNRVALGNSNPTVVRLANRFITRFAANPVTYQVQFHEDQDPGYLQRFWAFGLGVEPDQIRLQKKSNSGRLRGRNWRCKWGVISVGTNDTQLRSRLEGWMQCVQEGWVDSGDPGV
jgi:transcriptional regulator with XRE-family HTH domain